MSNLIEVLISLVTTVFDHVSMFLSSSAGESVLSVNGITLAMSAGFGAIRGNINEGVLAATRRWHGSIDDKFSNIDNLITKVNQHSWSMPMSMIAELTNNRDELQAIINKCRTTSASHIDRDHRDSLLKSTIGFCLDKVKTWAYGEYSDELMTADDVHSIGFLLPREMGGSHRRAEPTDVKAEIKVTVINADFIRVVINQSAGENDSQVVHGWPGGVRFALIVILAEDGKTEVYRKETQRLHNDIDMPKGSHGKQFMIKASFLRHVNDSPRFGNEPTFSMPLTTEELALIKERQHNEEFEAQQLEVERHLREIERIQAEMNAKK
jgi:hypothetical protein